MLCFFHRASLKRARSIIFPNQISDQMDQISEKKTKITHLLVHEGSCHWNFAGSYGQKLKNHILFFAPKLFWQMTELAALFRGDFDQ